MKDVKIYLQHVLENLNLIIASTKALSKSEFEKNKDILDATIRRIEIIGEAVKNLPEDFRIKYPKIEWKKIAGTRDILIHSYFNVDLDTLWAIIEEDLPSLKKEIALILSKEEKASENK